MNCCSCGIKLNPKKDKIHESIEGTKIICNNCYDELIAEEIGAEMNHVFQEDEMQEMQKSSNV